MLRLAAFVALFVGLAAAVCVDQNARHEQTVSQPDDVVASSALPPGDSKRYDYQMGQISGETGVLADHAARGIGGIWHGRPLAVLIAVASFAAAGGLLIAADRSAR
jgi:hypothetical protein